MFSKLFIRALAFRVAVMKTCGGAVIDWDYSTNHVCKSHNYLYWTWMLHTTGGFIYSFLMVAQQLIVLSTSEEDKDENFQSAATTILGFGEAAVTTCICLLATVITINRDNVINLLNAILDYDQTMMKMLTANGAKLDKKHKMELRTQEFLIFLVIVFSLVLPAFLILALTQPIEPTQRMLKDWFEFEMNLTMKRLPVLILFYILLIAAGNGAVVLCLIVQSYYSMTTVGLEDITPKKAESEGHLIQRRYKFETSSLGVLKDDEVINLYRHHQMFNMLVNEILANILVSFQNVACIGTVVSMSYFIIAHHDLLQETGILGYAIALGTLCAGLFLQIAESMMLGKVCQVSDEFAEAGRKLVFRKSLFKKFLRTCRRFYVEQAYPFYHIDKETILLFSEQCLDYTAELLLSD